MHEAQLHKNNTFITLTYDDQNLPWDGSLVPPHFTKFMKRLRKHLAPKPIRFYHAGEYGDQLSRPHYHAIIFNHQFEDQQAFDETEGFITYESQELEKIWGKGFVTTAECSLETAAYIARYTLKKQTGEKSDEHYLTSDCTTGEIINLHPEYSTMSNRPGIGKQWYDLYQSDVFPHDTVIHKGKTIKTPRYYETLLQRTNGALLETIKARRLEQSLIHANDQTPERLAVREKVKTLNQQTFKRKYHEI